MTQNEVAQMYRYRLKITRIIKSCKTIPQWNIAWNVIDNFYNKFKKKNKNIVVELYQLHDVQYRIIIEMNE